MRSEILDFNAVWIVYQSKQVFNRKANLIWFSTKDIADLLAHLQENNRSGVRIYSGQYPDHEKFSNVNGYDYRGRNTLVFIPTTAVPTTSDRPTHQDEIPSSEVRRIVREIKAGNIPKDAAFNHGELCPPNCDGDNVEINT